MIIAVLTATFAWFVTAAILFFNPWTDRIYNLTAGAPGVRALPKSPQTIVKILAAILVQCILWALLYDILKPALPGTGWLKGLSFGGVLLTFKMIPREIDRLLLSTYPLQRLQIEFWIGAICCFVVGIVFALILI